jgi:LmbE family N-acetylglucosaminyl deacetylase
LLPPTFAADSRLLVMAPHPDDETLATGESILAAREAGAAVRVVFATDGDNNPWPQRWIEKRWHVDGEARARWAQRRRAEAVSALAELGVESGHARFLGWPDQGLTDCLMRDDMAERILAAEIGAFAPTHVALPGVADRHPDHGALAVLTELALVRAGSGCVRMEYVVHGENAATGGVPGDGDRQRRKQRALAAHTSQLRLSGGRLRRMAARPECFALRPDVSALQRLDAGPGRIRLRVPVGPARRLRRHELLIVLEATRSHRLRAELPRLASNPGASKPGMSWRIDLRANHADVVLEGDFTDVSRGWIKLQRCGPRLVVFDAIGWRDVADLVARPGHEAPGIADAVRARRADPVGLDA